MLESTLGAVTARLGDTLAAVPSATYSLPYGTGTVGVTTSVPANTLKVYAYGAPLSGNTVGQGGYSASSVGSKYRGQPNANDFAPNVNYIEFDNDGSTSWFFGSTNSGVDGRGQAASLAGSNLIDFVSVARHELVHSLGETANQPTFARLTSGTSFIGSNAKQANRGNSVPLAPDSLGHIADSLPSVMNKATTAGTRMNLTNVEWGILKDLGWKVVDPPGFYRNWDLFTQGSGGEFTVKVIPSRGIYLMQVDAVAGDNLVVQTRDGSAASEKGVDTFLKLFDDQGRIVAQSDDTGSSNKSKITWHFEHGGTFFIGAGTYSQHDYTLTTPPTGRASSQAFYLTATLTGTADAEPDNIVSATAPITIGPAGFLRTTTLSQSGDTDVFAFDAIQGHNYTATTMLPSGGGLAGAAIVSIYDATGRKLAGMVRDNSSGDGGSLYGHAVFRAPVTARYYAIVTRYPGPNTIRPDDLGITLGWGVLTSDGEYSGEGDREGASDYAFSLTDTAPGGSGGGGNPTGPTPMFPTPVVVGTGVARTRRRGLTAIALRFNVDLDASTTGSLGHYSLKRAGRDRKFGTRDDRSVRLRSAHYDPASRVVTVRLFRGYRPRQKLQLTVSNLLSSAGIVQQGAFAARF